MAFSPQFLDELRSRIGLAETVGKRVKLTRKGREHTGLCPFHKEKTPSFTVNEEKGFYHCFGCGAHGSVIDFVMETENLSFPEACERLAGLAGMEVPRDTPEEREREKRRQTLAEVMELAQAYFEKMLRMPEGRPALDYLTGRGLDRATIDTFRLGFAANSRGALKTALARDGVSEDLMVAAGLLIRPENEPGRDPRDPYDRFRGRVMFPITDRRGRVIAFGGRILGDGEPKYLNSPETALFHKGRVVYSLNLAAAAARKSGTMIVTEGYMDVIALYQAGFENAVAPLGTALTEEQIQLLWRAVPEPVLCFDGDSAGQRAAGRAAERALPLLKPNLGLRFALLPAGDDPDTLVRRHGAEGFQRVLDEALPLSEMLWRMESGGRIPKTPEAKAALQQRLKDHARQIEDPTVRSHFSGAFNDRIWRRDGQGGAGSGHGRKGKGAYGRRRDGWQPNIHLEDSAGPAARIDTHEVRERILLAVLINHPDAYDEIAEPLGTVDFSALELDKIRQQVLNTLAANSELDSTALITHLEECGYGDAVSFLLSARVYDHAYFARPETPLDEAIRGWKEAFTVLKSEDISAEILEAKRDFAENPTPEAWQRLSLLEQQKLETAGADPVFDDAVVSS